MREPCLRPLGVLAPSPGQGWTGSGLEGRKGILDDEVRIRVSMYLDGCPVFLAWMEHTRDVLGDRFGVDGGSAIASDGAFYWRVDASSYIREYGIGIPDEALASMLGRDWSPPSFAREDYVSIYRRLMTMLVPGWTEG